MRKSLLTLCLSLCLLNTPALSEDSRELVRLPPMMRDHMLGNMRDHLKAIDETFAALSSGETAQAARIAENRLGMSSLDSHGASHMAPRMPAPMKELGTNMHKAASRFARMIELSDLDPSLKGQQKVYQALHEITQNCTACHDLYRLH